MPGAEGGGIFISHRRQESRDFAGRLYDRLAGRFGEGQVFIDVDAIEPGVDFAEAISRAVAACQVLLAVIGPSWLTTTDEQGRCRLDNPDDIVRLEIGAALARDVRVIPILMEGAHMPRRDDLPDSLAGLACRNALLIRHESFRSDAGRLVTAIEQVLAAAPKTTAAPASPDVGEVRPEAQAIGETAQQDLEAARENRARAIRVLAAALRIAQSLTNENGKARALAQVAGAMATIDPDHAGRIAADAERIAQSTTNEMFKAWELAEVAKAMATIDPDRAERTAQSITDQPIAGASSKAEALAEIAKAIAAADPERAARLIADAERIAQSITIEIWKPRALAEIAKAMATIDPDHAGRIAADAERTAQSITDRGSRAAALVEVAKAMAVIDPDHAERIAQSITDTGSRPVRLPRSRRRL